MENIKENNKVSKPGYKHTKLGWIPDDWKVLTIGEFSNKIGSGITPKGGSRVYSKKGIPLIRSQNVLSGKLVLDDIACICPEQHQIMNSTKLKPNDVLLNITGASIGRSCVVPSGFKEGNVNQHVCIIRLDENVDSYYISTFLNSWFGQKQVSSFQAGGNREGLNFNQISSFLIPLPKHLEQQKIAQILSTWDKAIEKTEQLIQAKTQLKKGLMQQLLTGKKRFKEFEGEECKDFALSELVMFLKGSGLSKEKLSLDGHNECILYGELYTTYSEVIDKVISRTNTSEGKLSIEGDILIPASTTTVGIDLATASSLKKSGILLGGDINILRAKNSKYNPDFLAYYLTHVKKFDLASRAQGVTIIHLYGKHFSHVKIMLPSINEQNKIMLLLASIQKEIDLLESQKQQLVSQKKGLMQKLLTGELRINTEQNR